MDPIGTVRREDHGVHQHTIWVRQDPGYPDSELTNTEWTCIWSTAEGNIGCRLGDAVVSKHPIIGHVPGTPASTGADVEIGDEVMITVPDAEGVHAVVYHLREVNEWDDRREFGLRFTNSNGTDVSVKGFRRHEFTLIEKDEG